MTVAFIQAASFDTTSAVSVGVLIVVIGAAVTTTRLLTRIDTRLENAVKALEQLAPLPERTSLLEAKVERVEQDVNELWGVHRAGEARRV